VGPNDRSYLYKYDELNRLILAEYGKLPTTGSVFFPTPTPRARRWMLDALGNWSFAADDGDLTDAGAITFEDADRDGVFDTSETIVASEYHDADSRNRITQRKTKASPSSGVETFPPTYDPAGSIRNDGNYKYVYDAWNRLVKVSRSSDTALIAEYRYDALGRRINKKVFNSPGLDTYVDGDFFYYDGNRIVEFHRTQKHSVTDCWTYECPGPPSGKLQSVDDAPVGKVINGEYVETKVQTTIGEEIKNDSGVRSHTCTSCTTTTTYPVKLVRQLVYGLEGIDEEVAHFTDGTTLSAYYVLQDAGGDVVAIAKADGALHEQYFYEPYGTLLAAENYNGDSIDIAAAPQTIFALLFHKGLWRDHETGTYQNRNRFYIPALGRFGQPDPYGSGLVLATALLRNGQVASASALVDPVGRYVDTMNDYAYARNNPIANSDPSGLFSLLDLAGSAGIRGDLMGQTMDIAGSIIDSMHGLVFMANERNAEMDTLLGLQSNPFDTSEIDDALALNESFQKARMLLFAGSIVDNLRKAGTKLWQKYVRRAGGRQDLLAALEGGIESQRSLYGFQSKFWSKRINFGGKRVYQRDDLISPKLLGPDGQTNLQRMRNGNAPLTADLREVHLHHLTQMNDSPIAEVGAGMHLGNSRILNINPSGTPSAINRGAFSEWRSQYWKHRAKDFE
jgi:RHS repeat-associated protein